MSQIYKIVGDCIRASRTGQKMTLEELGALSGFNGSFIGQIERNEKKTSLATLSRIADALDVHVAKLVDGKVERSEETSRNRLLAVLRGSSAAEEELILTTVRHLSKALKKFR